MFSTFMNIRNEGHFIESLAWKKKTVLETALCSIFVHLHIYYMHDAQCMLLDPSSSKCSLSGDKQTTDRYSFILLAHPRRLVWV